MQCKAGDCATLMLCAHSQAKSEQAVCGVAVTIVQSVQNDGTKLTCCLLQGLSEIVAGDQTSELELCMGKEDSDVHLLTVMRSHRFESETSLKLSDRRD